MQQIYYIATATVTLNCTQMCYFTAENVKMYINNNKSLVEFHVYLYTYTHIN